MRIVLRSTGGFSGPAGAETRSVDLDALPAADAAHLRQLAQAAHLFSLPSALTDPQPQSWDFLHVLDVEDGPRSHRITFHEKGAPRPLLALYAALRARPVD